MFKRLFIASLLFLSLQVSATPILGPNTLAVLGPHTLAVMQDSPQVSSGLSTYLFRVPSTGFWYLRFWSTFSPGSSLAVKAYVGTLASSSAETYTNTLAFTAATVGQTQTALQFTKPIVANAGNVIQVIMSSIGAPDLVINAIKSGLSIGAQ